MVLAEVCLNLEIMEMLNTDAPAVGHSERSEGKSNNRSRSLFRTNAARAARERAFYGTVSIATPVPYVLVAIFSLLLVISGVLGVCYLKYDHKVIGNGAIRVASGEYNAYSPIAGNVIEVTCQLGDAVKKGQVIAKIKLNNYISSTQSFTETALRLVGQRKEYNRSAYVAELSRLEQLIIVQKLNIDKWTSVRNSLLSDSQELKEHGVLLAKVLKDYSLLHRDHTISINDYLAKLTQNLSNTLLINETQRHLHEQESEIHKAKSLISDYEEKIKIEHANFLERQALLKKELAILSSENSIVIVSQATGFISQLNVRQGDSVSPSSNIAVVTPDDYKLEGLITLFSKDVGLVAKGQTVNIKVDAFPFLKYGSLSGVVSNISWKENHSAIEGTQRDESAYSVSVNINPKTDEEFTIYKRLRSGFTFSGEIVLDNTSLFSWVFKGN